MMNGVAKCLLGVSSRSYLSWLPIRRRLWRNAGPNPRGGSWAPSFRREAQELEAFEEFFMLLQEKHPISYEVDKWRWKGQGKGRFTVSSFYQSLVGRGDTTFPWKGIWVNRVPRKVCFFTWAAARGAILTIDNLMRRRMVVTDWCYMCKKNAETADHLLIHCDVASELWSCVFSIFEVQWVRSGTVRELLESWSQTTCRRSQRLAWRVVPLCLCWSIWRKRNLRAFEDTENSLIFLKASFISLLFLWMRRDFPSSPSSLLAFLGELHSTANL